MLVTAAGAFLAVFVVMVSVMMVLIVIVVMLVTAAGAFLAVFVVMMPVMMVHSLLHKLLFKRSLFKCAQNLFTAEIIEMRGNYIGILVYLADDCNRLCDLLLAGLVCSCQKNAARILYLILIEFAEVLSVYFAFRRINNCDAGINAYIFIIRIAYRRNNIGKLADARGLDYDSVRAVGSDGFSKRSREITDEATANAA